MSGREDRPLAVLIADWQPIRRDGMKDLLEGGRPGIWTPPIPIEVVGEAETGAEAMRLASRLAPDVAIVDPSIGDAAGDGCSAAWLVLALRLAGVERVVLFGGEEDLHGTTMEEVREDSGADAAIEAGRSAADLANAVAETKSPPPEPRELG